MTEVVLEDGSKMETTLPADKVADLQVKPDESAKPAEAEKQPAKPEAEGRKPEDQTPDQKAEPKEPAKTPESAKPEEPVKPKKASPIANLLNQRHELETSLDATKQELESERKSKADLEAKIAEMSKQPAAAAQNKLADLAKKYNVNADLLKELVDTVREGMPQTAIPDELKQLLEEQKMAKAIAAETAAFNSAFDEFASSLPDEPIKEQKDKLMQLAYSLDKAPDGKPYSEKELSVLYFKYIKPTIEPGTASAESTRRAPTQSKVVDFQEIFDRDDPKEIENMDDATFSKFSTWLKEKQGRPPLRNPSH